MPEAYITGYSTTARGSSSSSSGYTVSWDRNSMTEHVQNPIIGFPPCNSWTTTWTTTTLEAPSIVCHPGSEDLCSTDIVSLPGVLKLYINDERQIDIEFEGGVSIRSAANHFFRYFLKDNLRNEDGELEEDGYNFLFNHDGSEFDIAINWDEEGYVWIESSPQTQKLQEFLEEVQILLIEEIDFILGISPSLEEEFFSRD